MTASSDLPQVPSSSAEIHKTASEPTREMTASGPTDFSPAAARENRQRWPWLIGLALLVGGLGIVLWRLLTGQGNQAMQGPQAVPVQIERLQESSLEDSDEFVGTLDSQASVSLQPEADGRVVQIFVSEGDFVAAGDPIMQLSPQRSQSDYNAALASVSAARSARDSARAQLRAARERQTQLLADLDLQETEFNRTATLVERGALPQERLDEVTRDRTVANAALNSAIEEIAALEASLAGAEATLDQADANANATQQDLIDKTVTSPIAGTVGNIDTDLGDYVQAGSPLVSITQNQDLDLDVAVPVNAAQQLKVGLPVELSLFGSDEAIATGNIRFVSPTIDSATQTILAKARFSTPEQPLQDSQRLEVRIIWNEQPGILIPTTAVSRLGGETFVFVPGEPDPPAEGEGPPGQGAAQGAEGDGPPPTVAKLQPVKLGALQGNSYQVLEGLNPGDTVITSGLLNLRDGVPITQQTEGEGPPSGGPPEASTGGEEG